MLNLVYTMIQGTGPKLRRKDLYYFDLVTFQVEDALFKVPKNHFLASSVFATIFTLPPGEEDVEGTEDKPFVLHGISEVDFESLLKFMYPPPLTNVKLTKQEWLSVLKLTTMWEFTDIRERAIQELSEDKEAMGSIDKIEHGKSCNVKKWEMEGYAELLKRDETVTNEEAERLGWRTAAKLLLLREQYLASITSRWTPTNYPICLTCRNASCPSIIYHRNCSRCGGSQTISLQKFTSRDQYDFITAIKKELGAETETEATETEATETAGNQI